MSLIVYPTTNYNSWISYADACSYFNDRLNSEEWDLSHSDVQQAALITAFNHLNELPLDLTDLESGDDDTVDALLTLLKRGQCEQALHLLKYGTQDVLVKDVSLGGLLKVGLVSDGKNPPPYSSRAIAILHDYIQRKTIDANRYVAGTTNYYG